MVSRIRSPATLVSPVFREIHRASPVQVAPTARVPFVLVVIGYPIGTGPRHQYLADFLVLPDRQERPVLVACVIPQHC